MFRRFLNSVDSGPRAEKRIPWTRELAENSRELEAGKVILLRKEGADSH